MMCKKHVFDVRFDLTDECALCTLVRKEIAMDVRSLREKLGWTQDQLAEYLGLDRSSVSRMESGREPSGPVRRLLDALCNTDVRSQEAAE